MLRADFSVFCVWNRLLVCAGSYLFDEMREGERTPKNDEPTQPMDG